MTFSLIRQSSYSRFISSCLMVTFVTSMVITPRASYAGVMGLPQPGTMVNLSPAYMPLMITGLAVHPKDPLLIDFIVSTGNSGIGADRVKKESDRLIKYFLACLTIPEDNQWVNLSPYEKDRIIPDDLGQTVLGQDMLAQDYILKQLTASLIYPEKNLGKNFWDKVYTKAREMYGTTQIPVNTFNKVWILPDTAKVYEHKDTVFVVKNHLTVMLDEDYLALSKHSALPSAPLNSFHSVGANIVRQIILPAIEQEVNTGKNFAQMRQIYNSMILAVWFKQNLRQALLNQVYTGKSKVNGVNVDDPSIKEKIYQQYLQAYKKGVFNYIKEEVDQSSQETVPRKYFSGGLTREKVVDTTTDGALFNNMVRGFPAGDVNYELFGGIQRADVSAAIPITKAHAAMTATQVMEALTPTAQQLLPQSILANVQAGVFNNENHVKALNLLATVLDIQDKPIEDAVPGENLEQGETVPANLTLLRDFLSRWDVPQGNSIEARANAAVKRAWLEDFLFRNNTYSDGVVGYAQSGRELNTDFARKVNPFAGNLPQKVDEVDLTNHESDTYEQAAASGVEQAAFNVYAIPVGGKGERLGADDPRVILEHDTLTGKSYLQEFIEKILSAQNTSNSAAKRRNPAARDRKSPLVLMTSDATHDKIISFLQNQPTPYFGMDGVDYINVAQGEKVIFDHENQKLIVVNGQGKYLRDAKQIVLVKQEDVPSMFGARGRFFVDNKIGTVSRDLFAQFGYGEDFDRLMQKQNGFLEAISSEKGTLKQGVDKIEGQIRTLFADVPDHVETILAILRQAQQFPRLDVKPHNHGDIHMLMKMSGLGKAFKEAGFMRTVVFQDTNAEVFNAIFPAVGSMVGEQDGKIVNIKKLNIVAVKLKPGDKVGTLVKFTRPNGTSYIRNVEYNQRDLVFGDQKVKEYMAAEGLDPARDFLSGNINVYIMDQEEYDRILDETNGMVDELVNPKATGVSRLEAMMQDIYVNFRGEDTIVSNFITRFAFNAMKNGLENALVAVAQALFTESPTSVIGQTYEENRKRAAEAGMIFLNSTGQVEPALGEETLAFPGIYVLETNAKKAVRIKGPYIPAASWTSDEKFGAAVKHVELHGIPYRKGARISLPFLTPAEWRLKINSGRMTGSSVLVSDSRDIALDNVDIDGALELSVAPGSFLRLQDVSIHNQGWEDVVVTPEQMAAASRTERMIGTAIRKHQTTKVSLTGAGRVVIGRQIDLQGTVNIDYRGTSVMDLDLLLEQWADQNRGAGVHLQKGPDGRIIIRDKTLIIHNDPHGAYVEVRNNAMTTEEQVVIDHLAPTSLRRKNADLIIRQHHRITDAQVVEKLIDNTYKITGDGTGEELARDTEIQKISLEILYKFLENNLIDKYLLGNVMGVEGSPRWVTLGAFPLRVNNDKGYEGEIETGGRNVKGGPIIIRDRRTMAQVILDKIRNYIALAVETKTIDPKVRKAAFGTSGDRGRIDLKEDGMDANGKAGAEFNIGLVEQDTKGIAEHLKATTHKRTIIIGYDARHRNPEFSKESASIMAAYGFRVIYVAHGSIPTPVLAYLTSIYDDVAGVINFTASHSPHQDGGMKFSPSHGGAADNETTKSIEAFANSQDRTYKITDYNEAKRLGAIIELDPNEAVSKYVDDYLIPILRETKGRDGRSAWQDIIEYIRTNQDFKLFVDPLQGTGVAVDQLLCLRMEAEVGRKFYEIIHTNNKDPYFKEVGGAPQPAGDFISGLVNAVKADQNSFGIAQDGDVDRFGVVDKGGQQVLANQMMALFVWFLKKDVGLEGYDTVVKTVASSDFVVGVANHLGLNVIEVPVGFKYVVKEVIDGKKVLVGGEESAHVGLGPFMKTWDDGFVVGLTALWILAKTGKSLGEYQQGIEKEIGKKYVTAVKTLRDDTADKYRKAVDAQIGKYKAETAAGVPLSERSFVKAIEEAAAKFPVLNNPKVVKENTLDGLKFSFSNDGDSILVRRSGTEPAAKWYVEVSNPARLQAMFEVAKEFMDDGAMVTGAADSPTRLFTDEEDGGPRTFHYDPVAENTWGSVQDQLEKKDRGKEKGQAYPKTKISGENKNFAALAAPGGIDLNSRNLKMESEGEKVNMTFNAAMIAQFRQGDFSGVKIQILSVVPVNLMPLLGLKEDEEPGQLAKA